MTKAMKARHGGFTLVELLIVIIIIAILAGMLLLATGSATDNAEATRIVNDLRNLKAAAMMSFVDNNAWPTTADDVSSLDRYLDRPFFANGTFDPRIAEVTMTTPDGAVENRTLVGFETNNSIPVGVQNKLETNAARSGVYGGTAAVAAALDSDQTFTASTTAAPLFLYMIMR